MALSLLSADVALSVKTVPDLLGQDQFILRPPPFSSALLLFMCILPEIITILQLIKRTILSHTLLTEQLKSTNTIFLAMLLFTQPTTFITEAS